MIVQISLLVTCLMLRVWLINCDMHYMLYSVKPSLVFVTESWLNDNVPIGCLDPNSLYHVIRCDRKTGRGGGVCVFVHRSLQPIQIHTTDNYTELELVCFDLLCSNKKLRFFCAYRPPCNDNSAQLYLDSLLTCITAYTTGNHTHIIVGDFNFPYIDWTTYSCTNTYINKAMLSFVTESGFYQFVNFATRDCNLLDIVLADDPLIISSVTAAPPLGNSDHLSVKFVLNVQLNDVNSNDTDSIGVEYSWHKADFEGMSIYLSGIDWHTMLYCNPSASSFWSSIVDTLWSAVAMFVPLRNSNFRHQTKCKCYPKPIRQLMAKNADFGNGGNVIQLTWIQTVVIVTVQNCAAVI